MIFQNAAKMKLRYPYKGWCTTEDLWDLSVQQLDSIYGVLSGQAKNRGDSLLDTTSNPVLDLQIEIIKAVVAAKQAQAQANENKALKAQRKARLVELMANKQDAALQDLDTAEIQALIDELD